MAETSIRMGKDLRPAYYDDFHCIMGACRYNCCDESWTIEFSKRDYLTVKRAPKSPELEELTHKCLRRLREREHDGLYAEFHASEAGRCAFHTPEGLCRLQMECGGGTLPKVCRSFPRKKTYTPTGYLERSLSPACEAVLALLWDLPEGIEFRSDPLPKEERRVATQIEEDGMYLWFSVVREWCIDILQNRQFALPQRIFLMGLGLKDLAGGEMDIQRWMERAAVLPDSVGVSVRLPGGDPELAMYLGTCLRTLLSLPDIDGIGASVRTELMQGLKFEPNMEKTTISLETYREILSRYEEQFRQRDYFMENLMVSVFFHLNMPRMASREVLWKSYINFCNLYAFYRFVSVMSCREGVSEARGELFRLIVFASRQLIHNSQRQSRLRDEFFKNDSATLAHMGILLCG